MSDFRVEFLGGTLWLTILLGLALVGLVFLYYRRTTPPVSRPIRWLLIGLRSLAVAALFLSLAQPIISYTTANEQQKRMAVFIDRSRSMNLPLSASGGQTRSAEVQALLDGSALAPLRDKIDLTYFAFAESLDVSADGKALSGRATDPGQALKQLRQSSATAPYDYTVMVSDGRVTEGEALPDAAASFDRPLYTVAVGDSITTSDLALDRVDYNEVVYAGRPTEVSAVISQRGEFTARPQLQLFEGGKVLTQKIVELPGDGKTGEASLTYTPSASGRMILDLNLTSESDEANTRNNRQKFSVRVLKSKLRILLYSSSVNQEYAYLNRFLGTSPDYEVVRVIDANGGDRLGERFPDTKEKLNSYDLVILLDPDLSRISGYYDQIVSYLSDRSGSLWLFMGEQYARSAPGNQLETLFPIKVASSRIRAMQYGRYHLTPDQQMIFHPAVKLAETREEIMAAWANQPPFSQAVPIDSLRSGAVALAYWENPGGDKQYAMAMRRMKGGKVLAVAIAPFWHWAMLPFGVGGDAGYYKNLMSGTIRWLTAGDESDRVTFAPEKPIFQSGEEVTFVGSAHDEGFRPIENAGGSVVLVSAKGDSTVAQVLPEPGKPGRYRANVGALPSGTYDYHAELTAENVRLGRFDGKTAVDEVDRETAFGDVDWTALAQASAVSGGMFASYRDIGPLVNALDTTPTRVETRHDIRLWDNLILLLIILGSLSAEWILRKQRQLL
ncbi:MAG: hypothetical protein PHR28_03795 [candidate division Zixibacteria bacterium]|nr:hypothetical protein [candidate division Zixibacteria bacterium]